MSLHNNIYFIKLERCEYDVEKMLKTTTKKNLYGGLDFNSIDKFFKDILNGWPAVRVVVIEPPFRL